MKRATRALSIVILAVFIPGNGLAAVVNLPKTGQTLSYYEGDDGAYQLGVDWPTPRFVDNGDGTMTDLLTGLMWLQEPFCAGGCYGFECVFDFIEDFNTDPHQTQFECELLTASYNDWRVPNYNEVLSLIHWASSTPFNWLLDQGFSAEYHWESSFWTSTTDPDSENGRAVHIAQVPYLGSSAEGRSSRLWPVRGPVTRTAAAAVWDTGQTTVYQSRDNGDLQASVDLPVPRFADHGDGTVTDHLTGLMWSKRANISESWDRWERAFYEVALFNQSGETPYDDWRLPNVNEARSLIDYSQHRPSLPLGHPFDVYVPEWISWEFWTSTTSPFDTNDARAVSLEGYVVRVTKFSEGGGPWTWPVRGPGGVADDCIRNVDTGQLFGNLQVAIDSEFTVDGHTIEVCPCNLVGNLDVDKSLTLRATGDRRRRPSSQLTTTTT